MPAGKQWELFLKSRWGAALKGPTNSGLVLQAKKAWPHVCWWDWKKINYRRKIWFVAEQWIKSWKHNSSGNLRWASLVAQMVENPPAMWETWVRSLEKGTTTHSSILAWRIPWIVHGVLDLEKWNVEFIKMIMWEHQCTEFFFCWV